MSQEQLSTGPLAISAFVDRQHGLITRAQLHASGLDDPRITRRVQSGQLRRVYRGVFSVGPLSRDAELMAVALLGGPKTLISHWAASGTPRGHEASRLPYRCPCPEQTPVPTRHQPPPSHHPPPRPHRPPPHPGHHRRPPHRRPHRRRDHRRTRSPPSSAKPPTKASSACSAPSTPSSATPGARPASPARRSPSTKRARPAPRAAAKSKPSPSSMPKASRARS